MQPQKPHWESVQAFPCRAFSPFAIRRLFTDYIRTCILSHPVRNLNIIKNIIIKKRKSFVKLDVFQCACQYITADNCYSWDTRCTCNGQETNLPLGDFDKGHYKNSTIAWVCILKELWINRQLYLIVSVFHCVLYVGNIEVVMMIKLTALKLKVAQTRN